MMYVSIRAGQLRVIPAPALTQLHLRKFMLGSGSVEAVSEQALLGLRLRLNLLSIGSGSVGAVSEQVLLQLRLRLNLLLIGSGSDSGSIYFQNTEVFSFFYFSQRLHV